MKKTATQFRLPLLTAVLASAPLCIALAADTKAPTSDTAPPAEQAAPAPVISSAPAPATAKLPYGVDDVLKLSRAQIGEEIILNYIHNSGTIYNLAPTDIVYLRDQGVSDRVVNAMLDQRKRAEFAVQSTPGQAALGPSSVPNAPTVANAPTAPAAPYADQGTTYVEAPLTPPASSVYVVPNSGAYYNPYYYPYYPYWYGPAYYGGWYGPAIGFGFRFGGYGGFRGGFHGGHGSFAHGGHR